MSEKAQRRFFLVSVPILVNLLIIIGGLIMVPTFAQTDLPDGIFIPNNEGAISTQNEISQADNPPPPDELTEDLDTGFSQRSTTPKSAFVITPTVYLKSRHFQPSDQDALDEQGLLQLASEGDDRVHVLIQLDFIPREKAKAEYAAQGLELLAYVPDYAWIASVSTPSLDSVSTLPGVTWIGELTADDKLDPAIKTGQWGSWNSAPDGTAAISVAIHKDENIETGRDLVAAHGGQVTGEVIGINLLIVEINQNTIQALAAEDAVQWIEAAAPPLSSANDGIRDQIGVNVVNAAPYNLDGTGIDVLVYDSGQVGNHTDFGTRLTHGDADSVSEHSTHVAGTVGGDGANSINHSGSALQWRGMAPAVDLISYGTTYGGSGVIFYENVPDIENDWAQAQNTYGADLGNASLGSNIYSNYYPDSCNLMGNYGSSSVLIDQIVRGGNTVVGLGDKYIATWAAGNERGWGTSCTGAGSGYGIVAPPAGAKNPIHVGGSNTNNNTQYAHTSWGPTADGRLKPIVTAGACQTSGDGGIKSTDNNPINAYRVMCGTSMATPAVSGGIALMLQHYRDVYSTSGNFWPSTAKAILMQTADEFGNPGPDFQWGYGQVDIHAAVDLISRKAFRQDNVDDDEIDVFKLVIPPNSSEVIVSLAWDDYEATLNANPTLINNLDLELVAPDGSIWRPWVLNPSSPANNATRGLDSVNNQEQVQVFTADEDIVGTWIVRVKGTDVPQGPQDYSLVCEGCQPLNIGVCQVEVSGTILAAAGLSEFEDLHLKENISEDELSSLPMVRNFISTGEIWQRSLETQSAAGTLSHESEAQMALTALQIVRETGPEAIITLAETLRGEALDLVMDEIIEAQNQLAEKSPPPEAGSNSEAEEMVALESQQAIEAENRAQAIAPLNYLVEGHIPYQDSPDQIFSPNAPTADLTVGSGCTYATIGAAITAANPGDRLLIEGGVTFIGNFVINKNLTLQGGYAGCASSLSAPTTLNGNANGNVVLINGGLDVTLENLNITNGSIFGIGGGIHLAPGSGTLNLSGVNIYDNVALGGGGLGVGENATATGINVEIYENSGPAAGGGVYLYGGSVILRDSSIHDNTANLGGGVHGVLSNGYAPNLSLPSNADVYDNQALAGDGFGGGIYMSEGGISVADCSDIESNDAIDGGGVYLITSTVTIEGSCSEIQLNTATENGGGVYAQGSFVNLDNQAELYDNDAGTDGSGSGGGAYLDDSDLWSDRASIRYNSAGSYGGGVYATNSSRVDMDLGSYTCLQTRCSQLDNNIASNYYGGGIYASNSTIDLLNTFVENNTANLGGGLYAGPSSTVVASNNVFARNSATGSVGDGIRLNSASMSGSGNTLANNNAGGASTGRAIDSFSSTLTLGCSIIWGHTSSIDPAGLNVTYSDIEGGYTGAGNMNANPLFVSSGSQDYHLQNTSPVIDRCVSGSSPDFENQIRPIVRTTAASPYDMGADEADGVDRVGLNGGSCAYGTIQQAVNAASSGDALQVAEGVYFENVNIPSGKNITLTGGYDSTCLVSTGGSTRIEGSAGSGSTFDISESTVTINDLDITWGSGNGAGIDAIGGAQVTLSNTDVYNNHGGFGGGINIGSNSSVTTSNNSEIHHNTASSNGGGVNVWGQFSGNGNYSDIYENCADHGGGFYVPGGNLNINSADTYLNQAANANGLGGGIYVTNNGNVTLSNGAFVYYLNQAYNGAGIYADDAQVSLSGGATTLRDNIATNNGGGVYLTNGSFLNSNGARIGQIGSTIANEAQRGAGIYASASTIEFTGGYIINNIASTSGGGIYANDSTLTLTDVQVGGTDNYEANQLRPSGGSGVGLYLTNGTQASLESSLITSNIFQTVGTAYGGGAYLSNGSVLTLTNSTVENHLAPSTSSGIGAGIYINDSTVTLDNSQVISNTAGRVGGGLRLLSNSTLTVFNNSLIADNQVLAGEGGGIYASSNSTISIHNASLKNNVASTDGGGIYNTTGTLNVTQSTFDDNTAERGGAIFQTGASAQSEIENTLIHHNTSTTNFGAGIRTEDGVFTMTHVTLADNQGGGGYSQMNTEGYATNSIAWGNDTAGFWFTSGTLTGVCSIDQSSNAGPITNPQFIAPGAAENYHLAGGSPAVDTCTSGLPTDLEGISRPFGSNFDMGAYEYASGIVFTANQAQNSIPASVVSYAHTLTNSGTRADTFNLTAASSQGWAVTIEPAPTVALGGGESTTITLTVNIPAGALVSTVDTTTLTAPSTVDPSLSASVSDTTTVIAPADIELSPLTLSVTLAPGGSANRTLTIQNNGTATLNWTQVEIPERSWLNVNPTNGNISGATNTSVDVTFNATGLEGGVYTTLLRITSNDPDEPQIDVPITLNVPYYIYLPLVLR